MTLPRKWMWIPASTVAALVWSGLAQAQPTAPPPPPPLDPWYEALDLRLFADAYGSINYNFPKPQANANGPRDPDAVGVRAYDNHTGFGLSWVGFDVGHAPEPIGGTISLRLGPTAATYADSCLSSTTECDGDVPGLGFVKQAYGSWRPGGPDGDFTFDFGKFDTIYGAEVAESQDNLNYTRGALYWLGQPLFHTGLRIGWNIIPEWQVTVLAVNGWNNTVDNNAGKTFGIQGALHPFDTMSIYLGWLAGPEQDDTATLVCDADTAYNDNTGDCYPTPGVPAASYTVEQGGANEPEAWRELMDLVVTWVPHPRFRMVLNADYGRQGLRRHGVGPTDIRVVNQQYYGAMLGARYQLCKYMAMALRGEYFGDPDGMQTNVEGLELATGTLTLEAMPSDFLQLRLEQHGDFALGADGSTRIFKKTARGGASEMLTTTLGVVVTTN